MAKTALYKNDNQKLAKTAFSTFIKQNMAKSAFDDNDNLKMEVTTLLNQPQRHRIMNPVRGSFRINQPQHKVIEVVKI